MTRLMVLGLLTLKPMTGYEMQQLLQQSQTDQWAGILPGSIYHALKKLDKEGLVEIESIGHTGNRAKAVYQITAAGREAFTELLLITLQDSSVLFPTGMYTALSFIEALPVEDALKAIDLQKSSIEASYKNMKDGEELKKEYGQLNSFALLTFENIYAHYRIQLDFLAKLKELLLAQQTNRKGEGKG
ncbi:PadR family transcriptional regulator [Bacillus horti]|uniref:DNA-binding PadR family transcriptional regulator n=1 Tax=Caldalkalibacillus horti TaxID=77523 RepID=A0ABT9W4V5_9BACI|nr:PadR family transcriptional regulator [Bacillus horti]MDQ0168277.1 DNA-binding PadR family transcriptional regulator [Bacillus horti]